MKYLLLIFSISIVLFGCKKKDDPQPTTYNVNFYFSGMDVQIADVNDYIVSYTNASLDTVHLDGKALEETGHYSDWWGYDYCSVRGRYFYVSVTGPYQENLRLELNHENFTRKYTALGVDVCNGDNRVILSDEVGVINSDSTSITLTMGIYLKPL